VKGGLGQAGVIDDGLQAKRRILLGDDFQEGKEPKIWRVPIDTGDQAFSG